MKKAPMFRIKYPNQDSNRQLISSYNNIEIVRHTLVKLKGFDNKNITIFRDDGETDPPTYENIKMYMDSAISGAMSTIDKLLIYFSAHDSRDQEDELRILAGDLEVIPGGYLRDMVNPAREKTRVTIICEVCESSAFFPKEYFESRLFKTVLDAANESFQLLKDTKLIEKGAVFFSASKELCI